LVRAAADHYKVVYKKYLAPGEAPDRYSIDHTAGMFLLGPDGEFIARIAHGELPRETAARIAEIMAADDRARLR
jgi:protein SCO1/2